MKLLWILLIAQVSLLINTAIAITPNKCCDNDTNLIIDKKCAPDVNGKSFPMKLKCPDKFVLDPLTFPDEDSFNITSDGSLNGTDFQNLVPPEE
jgi:hypothetical protein